MSDSELLFKLIPQRYYHSVDAELLPENIRELLYEKGCSGDYGINYMDGDFDLPISYEQLEKEFGDLCRLPADELEEGEEDPFDLFLYSIPEPYYRTDCKFLVRFCH